VAANEIVSSEIGKRLGLPMLDSRIVEMGGQLFFASTWMQKPSFHPQMTRDLFARCENRDRVYQLVVFDAWICNRDRHEGNLLVRTMGRAAAPRHMLLLNDHSHAFVWPNEDANDLARRVDEPLASCISIDYVKAEVKDSQQLSSAIRMVEQLSESSLELLLGSVPEELLRSADRTLYQRYLLARQAKLRQLFVDQQSLFTQLGGTLA
jgi:hypothetical protein